MTDLKFDILTEIYNASLRASINKTTFFQSKGEDFPEYGRATLELRDAEYLKDIGGRLEMTPQGITAMEEEIRQRKEREEDIQLQRDLAAEAARDAQKARRQEWIAIIVTALLSLAAFVKSFF